ncbi:MAG: xanthine dehydrogenase family protein molybdopterin-binding subunit [Planctomycetota bacterium]
MIVPGGGSTRNTQNLNRDGQLNVVGQSVPLVDGYRKSTGQAIYTDDIKLPGMLYCRILRSIVPHAKIKRIDTSKAAKMPGVRAIVTGAELPNKFGVLPISRDETAMALDKVHHIGECVAGVAADTEQQAADAAWAIEVEYENLPSHLNLKDGLKPVEHPVHEKTDKNHPGTNVHKAVDQDFGDIQAAKASSKSWREYEFTFQGCNHGFTEPHSTIAHWNSEDRLVVYSAQQVVHYLHRALSEVFEIPAHQVQVIKPAVGGGFGGKSDPFPHELVAAALSRKVRRPVKVTFDREEVFLTHHGRHPTEMKVGMGIDKKGKITGLESSVLLDGGAFGSFGVVTSYYNGVLSNGPFMLPSFKYSGRRLYTNRPPSGAMRGHGSVNARFATETLLDMLAEDIGMDPIDLRLQNILPENTLTEFHRFRITSNGLKAGIETVRKASGWDKKRGKMPYGRGIGIGCGMYISGSALPIHWDRLPQSTVHLKIDKDGGVTAHTGAADIGQGSDTVVAQCVAEVLGLPVSQVHVKSADTDISPTDMGSYSSRVTFMNGNAARKAAEEVRKLLADAASKITKMPAQYFDFKGGKIYCHSRPDIFVTFQQALDEALDHRGALVASGCYESPPLGGAFKGANAGLSPSYSFSAFVTELEVDPETGFVKLHKVWAAHDCGKALNPLAVEGQIEGSIHMGIGQALSEGLRYRGARILNASLLDYKIPSTFETPPIEVFIIESQDPEGPFGAKECGEGALAPIIPSIGNAIFDAVGVRLFDVPMTPDKILAAIEAKKAEGKR